MRKPARKPAIEIFNDSSDKRMAYRVLDRKGIPADYKEQYIAEKDMDSRAKKYVKNRGKRVKKYVK